MVILLIKVHELNEIFDLDGNELVACVVCRNHGNVLLLYRWLIDENVVFVDTNIIY